MRNWENLVDGQVINGRVLEKGQVITGLTDDEVRVQTDGGVCLSPVSDDDEREPLDVSKMPAPEDEVRHDS